MKCLAVIVCLAICIGAIQPCIAEASERRRRARFARLYRNPFVMDIPGARLNVFYDEEGLLQIRGRFGKMELTTVVGDSLLSPDRYEFTDRRAGEQKGVPFIEFSDADMRLVITNDYNVDKLNPARRKQWQKLVPGSVIDKEGSMRMPTAVVLFSEAGAMIIGAFDVEIPLQ